MRCYDAIGTARMLVDESGTITDTCHLSASLRAGRVLEETDDNGAVLARYTTESGSYYEPLHHIWRTGDISRFPLYDNIGTAHRLVDASGVVTDTYQMDAFGRYISGSGSTPNPYKYGGAWGYIRDPSNLLQLGARFYWPEIGRFVQQDPIGDGMNWYAYAGNNPLVWVDPEGLWRFAIEGYYGIGGGINFGVNPDGGWYFGVRGGYGIGGGVDLDPRGTSPGWKPTRGYGPGGYVGVSGSAAASLGPANLNLLGLAGGARFPFGQSREAYGDMSGPGVSWSWPNSLRLSLGASAGVDVGFVADPCDF